MSWQLIDDISKKPISVESALEIRVRFDNAPELVMHVDGWSEIPSWVTSGISDQHVINTVVITKVVNRPAIPRSPTIQKR